MRSSSLVSVLWTWALPGLLITTTAADVLATFTPCPECPQSIMPAPITITAQYQPVSTCTPTTTCSAVEMSSASTTYTTSQCQVQPSCTTYDWVSTTIPYLGGASSTLITGTDQVVELARVSTVFTTYFPCATAVPNISNGTTTSSSNGSCTSTTYQTLLVDFSAQFDECGPIAVAGWDGSGLCTECTPNDFTTSQVVDVHSCLDGSCSDYVETWVVVTRTQTASSTETAISTQCSVSSGVNTVPVIATVHPSGNPDFTAAVTTTCQVTTYVASAGVIDITTIVIVTFTVDISFNTVINGITQSPTAPAVNPANPTDISGGNGGGGLVQYTTSTIYSTQVSTIINCPAQATICPAQSTIFITQTISVGITVFPVPTASLTSGGVSPTTSPSITPSAPAAVGNFEYIGCLASTEGFTTFNLELTSAQMDIELCTSECETLNAAYSGVYEFDCYCATALDTSVQNLGSGTCNIPCPGNPLQSCGGNVPVAKLRRRDIPAGRAIDVFEAVPTTTASPTASPTTSGAPDPSSDPDPEVQQRDIQADMEKLPSLRRSPKVVKLRQGGMLRHVSKAKRAPAAKRDFGVKQIFGL